MTESVGEISIDLEEVKISLGNDDEIFSINDESERSVLVDEVEIEVEDLS